MLLFFLNAFKERVTNHIPKLDYYDQLGMCACKTEGAHLAILFARIAHNKFTTFVFFPFVPPFHHSTAFPDACLQGP